MCDDSLIGIHYTFLCLVVMCLNGLYKSMYNMSNFTDGIPNDGIPIEEVVTVSLGLTVFYVILATAGLVFAAACLIFILVFRGRK